MNVDTECPNKNTAVALYVCVRDVCKCNLYLCCMKLIISVFNKKESCQTDIFIHLLHTRDHHAVQWSQIRLGKYTDS